MTDDPWDDDEDWYDDEDDQPEDEPEAACPECGAAIYLGAEMCPECGYWLTEADRRAVQPGASRSLWIKIAAVVALIAFVTVFVLAVAF
jgi:predicted nucleic acid-binding Zn ribbon protein